MLVAGALDAVIDVAQNAHGLRVQRRYGRSIVNSFHGWWSVGAVAGGLMGAAAAGLGLSLAAHLATSAVLFAAVALVAARALLPGPEDAERAGAPVGHPARPRLGAATRLLGVLGLVAACGALVEDAASSWGAIYLRDELGAAAVAGLAFVAFQVAMTTGRLLGDRVVDRFGPAAVGRAGGGLAAAGMGFALAVPGTASTLGGFALAGLGVATLVPAAMHAADELPGLRPGLGLTVVSWLLRVGFLVSAPVVGAVADAASLRAGLGGVVVAGVVVVAVGGALGPGDPKVTPPGPPGR